MTGKRLSEDHRVILSKLLQIPKLSNHEIAWVLNVDERTVRRRRGEFDATGQLAQHKDVSKNAEKLKEHHMEQLVAWHKDHPDALLDDMQLFLKTQCGLEVSVPTISRGLKKSYGTLRRIGRCARIKSRKEREAEGRSIASEIQQGQSMDADADADAETASASALVGGQSSSEGIIEGQQCLEPLPPVVSFQRIDPAHVRMRQQFLPEHVRLPPRSPQHHQHQQQQSPVSAEPMHAVDQHGYDSLHGAHFEVIHDD